MTKYSQSRITKSDKGWPIIISLAKNDQNDQEWPKMQMTKDDQEWPERHKDGQELRLWSKTTRNDKRWPKMSKDDQEWPRMTWPRNVRQRWPGLRPRWPKMTKNGTKMTGDDQKWQSMTEDDQGWPRVTLCSGMTKDCQSCVGENVMMILLISRNPRKYINVSLW